MFEKLHEILVRDRALPVSLGIERVLNILAVGSNQLCHLDEHLLLDLLIRKRYLSNPLPEPALQHLDSLTISDIIDRVLAITVEQVLNQDGDIFLVEGEGLFGEVDPGLADGLAALVG